jgi:uncharacterized protein (TIGR02328 family)
MRLWHYKLLPYLPDAQFKGQLRELVAIMHDWRDKGKTNHLLINRVMEYDKEHLTTYFMEYSYVYKQRYGFFQRKYLDEFCEFCETAFYPSDLLFKGWHNTEYLRVCVCNLYEKYRFGIGKSKITQTEWDRILQGYKEITGEEYQI